MSPRSLAEIHPRGIAPNTNIAVDTDRLTAANGFRGNVASINGRRPTLTNDDAYNPVVAVADGTFDAVA
jgi:hypothetical protein